MQGQLDFIFFFYGLGFILLAAVSIAAMRQEKQSVGWIWLGLFGLTHGLNEWFDLLAISVVTAEWFALFRQAVLILSFVLLLEFGRSARRTRGPWVHFLPILPLIAAGILRPDWVPVLSRYLLGFPASLWAAWVLWRMDRSRTVWLSGAAISMAAYSVFAGLVTPERSFFPANWVHYTNFIAWFGVPVQLIRGILACSAAGMLWLQVGHVDRTNDREMKIDAAPSALRTWTPVLLVLVIAVGWCLTEQVSSRSLARLTDQVDRDSREIACHLDRKVQYAVKSAKLMAEDPVFQDGLGQGLRQRQEQIESILDRTAAKFDGSVCYVMDRQGRVLYSSNRGQETSFVGKNYSFRSYFQDAMNQGVGAFIGVGITSGKEGLYASSALPGAQGPSGVVVIKQTIKELVESISFHQEAMLVDSTGRILISSRPELTFRQAWPTDTSGQEQTVLAGPIESTGPVDSGDQHLVAAGQVLQSVPAWQIVLLGSPEAWQSARWLGMCLTLCVCLILMAICIGDSASRNWARQLGAAKGQFESLVQCSPNFVAMLTADGCFCRVNARGAQLVGKAECLFPGRDLIEVFGPDGRPLQEAVLAAAREGRTRSSQVNWIVAGRQRSVDAYFNPVGKVIPARHVVMVANDVTDRQRALEKATRAGEATRKANIELQKRAKELERARQAAMTMCEGLEQARAEAVSANEAKGQFLANISHEFRTPLNGILGLTNVTLETELSGEQREYLEMVNASAESLLRIVEDILDFSRIDARKLTLCKEEFSLRKWFWEIMKSEALECDRKGIELIGRISSEMPDLIVGDPGRLGQVLVNLLSNAVKFTEQGQVAVSIECVRFADGEARFRLEVEDSGPGICQKQLQEIFSAFHQADTSNHRKHGGTGLGLAICRQLVELMGGRIWAESSPGNGARFLVDLTVEARAACSDPRSRQLQQRRVLLVESNPDQCKALVEQVEQLGMSVQVAGSGSAAEAMLIDSARRGECPEVTILSADLQDEDGLELAGQLARSRQIATKLILLGRISSNGDVVSRSHEAGAVGILHKPVADGDLRDAICEALGIESQEQQQAPGRQQSDAPEADRCLRILVAEDNPVNQRLASILLEKKGHTVLQATDGCKAVEAFKAEAIDVILMDIQMPEMDGLAATQEIRRLEWAGGGGHIPIIAMTAHAMQRDKQRCLQGGMDFYLSKPIRAGELYETLQRAANGPGLGDLPAEPTTDEPGEAFDVARALRNLDDDLNLLGQLAEMALQEIPQQVRTVDCAIAASDAGGLVDASLVIAHSAGSLSARSVAESARRLAQVAEDGDWECVTAAAAKMKQDLQALLKGIEGFILRREPAA